LHSIISRRMHGAPPVAVAASVAAGAAPAAAALAVAVATLFPTLRLQPLLRAPPLQVTTRALSLLPSFTGMGARMMILILQMTVVERMPPVPLSVPPMPTPLLPLLTKRAPI
jgi:hypothetical protein